MEQEQKTQDKFLKEMTGWIYINMKTKLATSEQKSGDARQKRDGVLWITQ